LHCLEQQGGLARADGPEHEPMAQQVAFRQFSEESGWLVIRPRRERENLKAAPLASFWLVVVKTALFFSFLNPTQRQFVPGNIQNRSFRVGRRLGQIPEAQ
jgi:hypothetical protein